MSKLDELQRGLASIVGNLKDSPMSNEEAKEWEKQLDLLGVLLKQLRVEVNSRRDVAITIAELEANLEQALNKLWGVGVKKLESDNE
jgi:hypothetical protein